jgi:predicted component of type VI protein secretion system
MGHPHQNLLGEPPATLLPANTEAERELADGVPAAEVAAHHPTYSGAWAALAEQAIDRPERQLGDTIEAYAYARTGYHRGLDALRRNGWKGYGPVPWSHEPNRGFLRCLTVLARTAEAIGELDEQERCTALLRDCDPSLAP